MSGLGLRPGLRQKVSYGFRVLPSYFWQRFTRRVPSGQVHLMIAMANHFEPSIIPENGMLRAPSHEQERRLDLWCHEYPRMADAWRDSDGHPFVHTYFYPAEQYDRRLIQQLAEHTRSGWGEIEIHLHHGVVLPDTAAEHSKSACRVSRCACIRAWLFVLPRRRRASQIRFCPWQFRLGELGRRMLLWS